ncbi:hypothetical protein E4T44_13485 [Aureobasidium sp. EXF-8845]|nr:hypothetical protein E4T44_13485 [Aureobasidium sp. EXF-8845]KAI4789476.1 hypothetical protein E4T45_13383 [Aureobasidium sp. EXF-8846]
MYILAVLCSLALVRTASAQQDAAHHSVLSNQAPLQGSQTSDTSPNAHWMLVASSANLAISPCPFAPYGTAVVNHTLSLSNSSHFGELICTGVNDNHHSANPTLHGEMAAFVNCSDILTDPEGVYKLSANKAREA